MAIEETASTPTAVADEGALDAVLADLAGQLLAASSVERVVELVLGAAQFLCDSPRGAVGFLDASSRQLVVTVRGVPDSIRALPAGRSSLDTLPGWCSEVIVKGRRVLLNGQLGVPPSGLASLVAPGGPSRLLAMPATTAGAVIALVAVADASRDYTERDATRIERLSALFGLAIERTQAARALQESEHRYRTLVDNQGEGIGIVDPDETFAFANAAGERLFGVGPGGLVGRNLREFTVPTAYSKVKDQTKVRRAGTRSTYELDIVRADHVRRTLLITATPHCNADGEFEGTFGIFRDVTERRLAEASVRVSEARSRALYELGQREFGSEGELIEQALEQAVRLTGSEIGYFHFVDGRRGSVDLFAWSEAVRDECELHAQRHYPLETAGLWAECVRQRAPVTHNDFASEPGRAGYPDGHPTIKRHLGLPVLDRDEIVAVAGVANKTQPYDQEDVRQLRLFMDGLWKLVARRRAEHDKQALQQQLQVAQKMEAVGQLAGGVAHDFNNLLAAINGYADVLLEDLPASSPLREDVRQIRRAGDRGAALVRQLLAFGRRQVVVPTTLSLNEVVEGMTDLLRRLIGEDVILVFRPTDDLQPVLADHGQIEQILMNLATNARDAMPVGGTLTLETRNVAVGPDTHDLHVGLKPGPHVMLAVTDTGGGMDSGTRARLFEPFFTTKAAGKGTGLGLSTVYGIVQMTGGSIVVHTAVNQGTTFEILLPRQESPLPLTPPLQRLERPRGGTETVLVVEDEDAVRMLADRILSAMGYHVLTAANAAEALALTRAHDGPIHLLLADVVMPGLSGPQLAKRLTAERPGLRVLLTSGYTDDAIVHHGVLERGMHFLPKPFAAAELLARVRALLDRDEPAAREADTSEPAGD